MALQQPNADWALTSSEASGAFSIGCYPRSGGMKTPLRKRAELQAGRASGVYPLWISDDANSTPDLFGVCSLRPQKVDDRDRGAQELTVPSTSYLRFCIRLEQAAIAYALGWAPCLPLV
ncbi:hypothetical protein PG997_004147 [Apiospora hydei]|uniref:Uncharacterized protein n=1 Tax=Apiospora hydei TaxID=1337664 RepID=A0ABR1X1B4_9PEZI